MAAFIPDANAGNTSTAFVAWTIVLQVAIRETPAARSVSSAPAAKTAWTPTQIGGACPSRASTRTASAIVLALEMMSSTSQAGLRRADLHVPVAMPPFLQDRHRSPGCAGDLLGPLRAFAVGPDDDRAFHICANPPRIEGRIYYFSSKENRDRFEAAPREYARNAAGYPVRPADAQEDRPRRRGGC